VPSKDLIFDQRLNENTVPRPIVQITVPQIRVDVKREMENFSINHATAGSSREIAEVHAAQTKRTKNKEPNN